MSGYRCVHVPTGSPSGGGRGVATIWLFLVFAVALAWMRWGPVVVLGTLATVIATVTALAVSVVRANRRRSASAVGERVSGSTTVSVPCPTGTLCLNCQAPAQQAMAISGALIPLCAPCHEVALARIAADPALLTRHATR